MYSFATAVQQLISLAMSSLGANSSHVQNASPVNVSYPGGYSLGLRRNVGHASAATCVAMVASSSWVGGFKDKGIVIKFEHKACLDEPCILHARVQSCDLVLACAE